MFSFLIKVYRALISCEFISLESERERKFYLQKHIDNNVKNCVESKHDNKNRKI
jgi:hypothetical protein